MRQKLINTIASCNNKQVRRQWIIELSNMEDIECTESQCTSCIIADECASAMECMICSNADKYLDECDNYSCINNINENTKEVVLCQA